MGPVRQSRVGATWAAAAVLVLLPALVRAQTPGPETWFIHTRNCPQQLGTDPWPCLAARPLVPGQPSAWTDARALVARTAGRPTLFIIHGYAFDEAEGLDEEWTARNLLASAGAISTDTLVILFHWPSDRIHSGFTRDFNEMTRRTLVAGYHLGRLLLAFPPESRIGIIGQSGGGRIALTALHLLGGDVLDPLGGEPAARLPASRTDLHIRVVLMSVSVRHDWLGPEQRLDQALANCDAMLNLYNPHDLILGFYPLGRYTGRKPALGRVGMKPGSLAELGPLAQRYTQHNLNPLLGPHHATLRHALTEPGVITMIAPYTTWPADAPAAPAPSNLAQQGTPQRTGRR